MNAKDEAGKVDTGPLAWPAVKVLYRNHKGEVAVRVISPGLLYCGRCKWHAGEQWLLDCYDHGKKAERTYAMSGILAWGEAEVAEALARTRGDVNMVVDAVLDEAVAEAVSKAMPKFWNMVREEARRSLKDAPRVVCLCGSTRFLDEYQAANKRETLAGRIVLSVGMFGHHEGIDMDGPVKQMLDELHLAKIDLADEVLVIDATAQRCPACGTVWSARPDQGRAVTILNCSCGAQVEPPAPYIGESTRREIAYAEAQGKPVRYLSKERDECPGHERGGTRPKCCDRAGEYNGFGSDGPLKFECPAGCSCHD